MWSLAKDVVGSDVMKVLLLKKYTNMICLLCFSYLSIHCASLRKKEVMLLLRASDGGEKLK